MQTVSRRQIDRPTYQFCYAIAEREEPKAKLGVRCEIAKQIDIALGLGRTTRE